MGRRTVVGVVVVMVGVVAARLTCATQILPAAERAHRAEKGKAKEGKRDGICVDVVIEEADFSANTITARATIHVVPPRGNVGGQVFMTGTTNSHKEHVARYVRIPVMPEANLQEKKPKAGLHAILRLEMLPQGCLVVVGIEEFKGLERIGVEGLDAPGTQESR